MDVNEKGSIGLIEVMRDLSRKGYECFTPIHDYSAVDLIVLNQDYKPARVQVKYRKEVRGVITVPFHSSVNGKQVPINKTAIDGFAVYCPEVETVVYVGWDQIGQKNIFTFRLTEGKTTVNKTKQKTKVFSELTDETVLWKRGEMVAARVC